MEKQRYANPDKSHQNLDYVENFKSEANDFLHSTFIELRADS